MEFHYITSLGMRLTSKGERMEKKAMDILSASDELHHFFKKPDGTVIYMFACLIAVIVFVFSSPQDTTASEPSDEPVYKVVSPTGESTVSLSTMAPRLDTLAGKTVCMVWNNAFKSDVTLPVIGEALKKQYPGVKIVPYTDMPDAFLPEPPGTPKDQSEALLSIFKEKGCSAVISGNGG